jgi:hypothetical protein
MKQCAVILKHTFRYTVFFSFIGFYPVLSVSKDTPAPASPLICFNLSLSLLLAYKVSQSYSKIMATIAFLFYFRNFSGQELNQYQGLRHQQALYRPVFFALVTYSMNHLTIKQVDYRNELQYLFSSAFLSPRVISPSGSTFISFSS